MSQQNIVDSAVDQELRSALIRANIALLQREVREKKDWYTTRRVVVRKRNGRIHLSRIGSRQQQQQQSGYISDDSEGNSFTLVDEPRASRSASSSFSSTITTTSHFA
ncbi:hypothetical protein M426DRAFT_17611 [Hypoxylon sp. CI-4A]|nr:hypothetical protein M426DRAFT_17611 [Hypoxylon sp. CI-4A]